MADTDTQIVQNGQRAVVITEQDGEFIYKGGNTDVKCIVATDDGPQLAYKVVNVGKVPLGTDLIQFVESLPETGIKNLIYAVILDQVDLQGNTIIELFIWNDEWYAVGAQSIDIDKTNLVLKSMFEFDRGTGTLNINLAGA